MGLDITAYGRLTLAPEAETMPEDDRWDRFIRVRPNEHFPGREEGLAPGWYAYDEGAGHSFRAGSYGGYNQWREQLAKLAGYPDGGDGPRHSHSSGAWAADGGPFWELIHFTDCDGLIGPVVSAKLARDFAEWDERAKAHDPDEDGWFYAKYQDWRKAFDVAQDGGAVDFH